MMASAFPWLFVLGAAVAGVSQLFTPTGWWLNSSEGVTLEAIVLFLLAMSVSFASAPVSKGLRGRAGAFAALWLGVMAGFSIALFAVGAGTLVPIVLVVAAALSAAALAGGTVVGLALRRLRSVRA
jgi:hypothetical protein